MSTAALYCTPAHRWFDNSSKRHGDVGVNAAAAAASLLGDDDDGDDDDECLYDVRTMTITSGCGGD